MTGPRKTKHFPDKDFSAMTLTVDLATLFKVTAQCLATNSILIKSKDD